MHIDKIVIVPRTGLYRLVLDSGEKIDVDVAAIAEFRLTKGLELSEVSLDELRSRAAYLYWTNKCLNKLARRPQSYAELTRFMQAHKVEPDVQVNIMDYLVAQKYVDDNAFADWYAKSAHRKLKSSLALRYELQQRGISRDIISHITQSNPESEHASLIALIAKKQLQARYKDELKLKQYLLRKGFSYDSINAALHSTQS